MLFNVFAEQFPLWFQDHVCRLQTEPQYRTDFTSAVAILPLEAWENSPKWKQTARFRRMLNPACERCKSRESLQVHHKTYKHKGAEVLYPGDLEVLCRTCHTLEHSTMLWPAAHCRPVSQLVLRYRPN
jgi:HNH endonuclease